MSNMIYCTRSK